MITPPPSAGVVRSATDRLSASAACSAPPRAARTAWAAFCSTLTSTVRRRSGSVRIERQRRREHGPDRDAGAAGLHGPRRLAADRVRVRVLPREREGLRVVEHLGHDPVEAHDLLVDIPDRLLARVIAATGLPQGPRCGLDDHQRVADLVGDDTGQAAERGQPFALRGFLFETRDGVGERVERRRQQACVFVLPGSRSHGNLAGEVAGGGDLAHHAGDRAERPRDRPRDGIAEHGRQQHRQNRGRADDRLDGAEEPQLFGPRPDHDHERRALGRGREARPAGAGRLHEGPRQQHVVGIARRDPGHLAGPARAVDGRPRLARQRRCPDPAVQPEGDVAARQLLEVGRHRAVEQEAYAQAADNGCRLPAHRDGHAQDLQQALRVRSEGRRGGAAERGAHRGQRGRRLPTDGERPRERKHPRIAVGDRDQAGPGEHLLVLGRQRLDRGRVAGGDGGFELGQVGNQPGEQRERLDERLTLAPDNGL